jgi:hypothetical protein
VVLLVLTLGSAGLGLIVGTALSPRFRVENMVIAFGLVGPIVAALTLSRLQRALRTLREEGQCTTELTPDGIIRRTRTRECKYRWVSGQRFVALGDDVLIFLRRDEILWLPRRAFSSPGAIESFLLAAQRHHADAMTRAKDTKVGVSGEA